MPSDENFIKRFLKLNEISSDSSDTEIHSVLVNAQWTEDEIQTAIMLIRGKPVDLGVVAVTKHNMTLFRPDMKLSSERLSSLLGVDVVIDPTKIRDVRTNEIVSKPIDKREVVLWTLVLTFSFTLAALIVWLLMYTMQFGPYARPSDWL